MNCPSCNKTIDEHEANRCLDLWIAQDVMKWELWTEYLHSNLKNSSDPKIVCQYLISPHAVQDIGIKDSSGFWDKATEIIPDTNLILHPQKRFSSFIETAWEVIEKLNQDNAMNLRWYNPDGRTSVFSVAFGFGTKIGAEAKTAPLAICRAALKVVSE